MCVCEQDLLRQMTQQSVRPNLLTFNSVLKTLRWCGSLGRSVALQVLCEMKALSIGEGSLPSIHIIAAQQFPQRQTRLWGFRWLAQGWLVKNTATVTLYCSKHYLTFPWRLLFGQTLCEQGSVATGLVVPVLSTDTGAKSNINHFSGSLFRHCK